MDRGFEDGSACASLTITAPVGCSPLILRGPDMGGGVGGMLYSIRGSDLRYNGVKSSKLNKPNNLVSIQTQQLYKQGGFFWNDFLQDFVTEYGNKLLKYPHYKTDKLVTARFCLPSLIAVGRGYSQHVLVARHFGEEVAPVGDCNNIHIELLLTQSGRLVGFADYLLLYWKTFEPGTWRQSIQSLLDGCEPLKLGIID